MAKLSPARLGSVPTLLPLEHVGSGKVRDTFSLSHGNLLIVASDGVSIYDFVLDALIPGKGRVLNAMNLFWIQMLGGCGIPTHLVASGAEIDEFLPAGLRGNVDLQSRAMVVRALKMRPLEFVARLCITGSGIKAYMCDGAVCGVRLPSGLQDGDQLPFVLDTPTTKSVDGHDVPMDAEEVRSEYPYETRVLIQVAQLLDFFAKGRGIKVADTKLEFGADSTGCVRVGDEVGTPDSSRFWDLEEWRASREPRDGRKAPSSLDKELVRQWGKAVGISDRDPSNPDDVQWVHSQMMPGNVISAASQTYRYIFWRLTGQIVERYLQDRDVNLELPRKKVALVLGSESDLKRISLGEREFPAILRDSQVSRIDVHVVSCHRNPEELCRFAEDGCDGADVVVAAGGKALALPGVLDAFLHARRWDIPVVGLALGEPGTEALEAARLSISQIPGQPVVMDERTGEPYTGVDGALDLFGRLAWGELPPPRPRTEKPAQLGFQELLF